MPAASPWLTAGRPAPSATAPAAGFASPGSHGVRHSYPLAVRDHGLGSAIGLLMQSLPYAMARFAVLLAATFAAILWLVIMVGGATWLSTHVANAFGGAWVILCLVGAGFFWATILRYALHLIACGHVAVLTELITRGAVGNGQESMFAYGRRIVTARFGQVTALFGLNALVRGVIQSFHRDLDWIGEVLPVPGLETIASLITMVLKAATRYLDKVIFSYNLARNDEDAWGGARDGIIYYCQDAKPILQTSIWIVILERLLSVGLFLVLLLPAAAITMMLPHAVRETGGLVTVVIAVLLAATLRASFLKPLFLIMIMVRFHTLIENQPINAAWSDRLSQLSAQFRTLGSQIRS